MPKTEHYQWYVEQFSDTEQHHHAIEELYFSGKTPFQSVAVLRTAAFGKMLVLDGDTQSSQADEKIYHESLVHPALAACAGRREVLILGGGEGATLREVLRHPDVARCTMVDIDGEVVELSKKYLPEWSDGAFDDPRANVIIGDALAYIKQPGTFDAIVSDLTEPLPDSPSAFDNDWAFIACSDAQNVAVLEPGRIDAYVGELRGENYFYDAETHRRLFSLPLYLRRELARGGDVFS
jgi:spermidine synthase